MSALSSLDEGLFDYDITAFCNFCKPKISALPKRKMSRRECGGEKMRIIQDVVFRMLKKFYTLFSSVMRIRVKEGQYTGYHGVPGSSDSRFQGVRYERELPSRL